MRILVTGSRRLKDYNLVARALGEAAFCTDPAEEIVVVHGACPYGGADWLAGTWSRNSFNVVEEPHPADFARLGKKAGPLRNQEMVGLGADLCLAFPDSNSRGTWDCVRRARAAGIPVEIHEVKEKK